MTLAAFTDANRFLDENKVRFENDVDAASDAISADRYVTGVLYDVYGAQVLTWNIAPTGGQVATPVAVVEIVAMLMAAYRYNKRYSLEENAPNTYATRLMAQANEWLTMIRSGAMNLVEAAIVSGVIFAEGDFWPNDTTVDTAGISSRKFTMDMIF